MKQLHELKMLFNCCLASNPSGQTTNQFYHQINDNYMTATNTHPQNLCTLLNCVCVFLNDYLTPYLIDVCVVCALVMCLSVCLFLSLLLLYCINFIVRINT